MDGIRDSLKTHYDAVETEKAAKDAVKTILAPKSHIHRLIDDALNSLRKGNNGGAEASSVQREPVIESRDSLKYQRVYPNPSSLVYNKEGKVGNPDALHPMHYQYHIPDSTDILKKIETDKTEENLKERLRLQRAISELTRPWIPPHQMAYPVSRFSELSNSETKDIDGYLFQEEALEKEQEEARAKQRKAYHQQVDELDEFSSAKQQYRHDKAEEAGNQKAIPKKEDDHNNHNNNNDDNDNEGSAIEFQALLSSLLYRNIWGMYSEDQAYLVFQRIIKETPKTAWKLEQVNLATLRKLNLSKSIM